MKKNKGITLVALVVTVIILLIIAGVAISMITGNDGLFTKANEAATLYNEEARKEAEWLQQLMDSEYFGGNGESGSSVFTKIFNLKKLGIGANFITLSVVNDDGTLVSSSGIKYQYKIDNRAWEPSEPTNDTTYTFEGVNADSAHTVNVRAIDELGNITEAANKDLSISTDKFALNNIVRLGGYYFYIIEVDEENVTLVCTTTIENANWSDAQTQVSDLGISLGGTGRLPSKSEVQGIAATYRNINHNYWLSDKMANDGGGDRALWVDDNGTVMTSKGNRCTNPYGVRPVIVISKSVINKGNDSGSNDEKLPLQPFDLTVSRIGANFITVSGVNENSTSGSSSEIKYQYKMDNRPWQPAEPTSDTEYTFDGLEVASTHTVNVRVIDELENVIEATNKNLSVTTKNLDLNNIVRLGEYDYYIIGLAEENVTLVCATTIGNASWSDAQTQASDLGISLGGIGMLPSKSDVQGIAATYRNINHNYWLSDKMANDGGGDRALWVENNGSVISTKGNRCTNNYGVRPIIVVSRSVILQ